VNSFCRPDFNVEEPRVAKISGVVNGVVVSRDDPDQMGRVQVSHPFLGGENTNGWAPVATMMAGNKTGSWFMPEIGDEVLVAFLLDDVEHPYVVGFMWNGSQAPPDSDPQNRVILTPGGHTLRFQDKDGSKKVILQSSSGQVVTLDDSGSGSITVTSPDGSVTINSADSSSITLQGGGRIFTMSGGTVQIS
jgi:phage baseplate assembly protein V